VTDTTKKAWSKPELIVLVRGRPEEAVLAACKIFLQEGPGYGSGRACGYWDGICSAVSSS
jgi:hypothetical protein